MKRLASEEKAGVQSLQKGYEPTQPNLLTTDEVFTEFFQILARGLIRLCARQGNS
jgi:hypothetical protein